MNSYEIFWWVGCVTSKKTVDLGADPDYSLGPGIFIIAGFGSCKTSQPAL